MLYLGAGIPLTAQWRLEPVFFTSRNGLPGGTERRLLLGTNYDLKNGWELGAGVAGGRAHLEGDDRDLREGFLRASYQVGPALRLQALVRHETVSGGDATTVLSVGTTFSWR